MPEIRKTRMMRPTSELGCRTMGAMVATSGAGASFRLSRRGPSVVADAGIDEGIAKVHDQIHCNERSGEYQHDSLDHRIIAGLDGVHQQASDPGPTEDRFGQHGAAEEVAELEADDRHDGQK